MPRLIDPFTQYQNNEGDLLSNGKLIFFKAGTVNEYLQTYFDNEEQTPHPLTGVPLDAAGRVPPIFYKGSARIELRNSANVLVDEMDDVGSENFFGDFSEYSSTLSYNVNDKTLFVNGKFYISLQNENFGNDPSLNPGDNSYWSEIRFVKVFNLKETYDFGEVAQDSSGLFWRSTQASNTGHAPTPANSTWWAPTYDIKLDRIFSTCVSKTNGNSLEAFRCNVLRDGGATTLPAANSVPAESWIDILQEDALAPDYMPIVQRAGADLIEGADGTDTAIQFDVGQLTAIRLVSNGVDRWKL